MSVTGLVTTMEPTIVLSKDLKLAAASLSSAEIRYLVDYYYTTQENRKAAGNQELALEKSEEPHALLSWIKNNNSKLEQNVKRAIEAYATANPIGNWAMSIYGIGPVIAGGLLAYIDMAECPTVGHIWRFAGLDPTSKWLGTEKATVIVDRLLSNIEPGLQAVELLAGEINRTPSRLLGTIQRKKEEGAAITRKDLISAAALRPWCASLKRLCWLIGESFTKCSGHEDCYYGHVYLQRKKQEMEKNEACAFKDQAEASLREKKYGKGTDAYAAYITGRLPQARIHLRAQRYAVKLFLSHFHWVAYEVIHKQRPPKPYVIEHLGHAHLLSPPNWNPLP